MDSGWFDDAWSLPRKKKKTVRAEWENLSGVIVPGRITDSPAKCKAAASTPAGENRLK